MLGPALAKKKQGYVVERHEAGDVRRPVLVQLRESEHGQRHRQESGHLQAAPADDVDEGDRQDVAGNGAADRAR